MRKVPKLRFKEFSDEWEEKKLEDIGEINPKSKSIPKKFVYIDLESVVDGQLKEKKIIEKEEAPSRAKRLVEKNDILYQMVRPYQQNNLYFSFNDELDYVASTGYAQIRTFYHNNSMYVYHLMHTKKFLDKVLERCTGTSYPAINSEDLSNISIKISKNINEQEKIANFLSSIDKKISLTEEKLELFREYKKGVMQKIFSQELRFKDNNGNDYPEWEEKKLVEISELTSSKRIFLNEYVDKGIPFYRGKEITELKKGKKVTDILYISNKKYNEILEKYDVPKQNEILITAVGTLGNVYLISNNEKFYFKDGNLIWLKNIKSLPKFLTYSLENNYKKILDTAIGSTQKALTIVNLQKLQLIIPVSLEEQQKISDFLSSIDSKIESIEKELDRLKEFKRGLLQQMFV